MYILLQINLYIFGLTLYIDLDRLQNASKCIDCAAQ